MIKLNYPAFWQKRNLISYLLLPFSWVYAFLGFLRKFYAKPIRLPAFVVCVGNMTAGGNGTTQIVIWLAKLLAQHNINFVIVTRGYHSKLQTAKLVTTSDNPRDVGDESVLLAAYGRVIAVPKIKQIIPLVNDLKPAIIIFDDGMQNPYFIKDFTILSIDPIRSVGNNLLIPAGPLREKPEEAINKADLILAVGNRPCSDSSLMKKIMASNKPFYQAQIKISNEIDKDTRYIAFTGIGNPNKFYALLRENNLNIIDEITYPDHYDYPLDELKKLTDLARDKGCKLITTKKDYVKLPGDNNIKFVDIELEFAEKQAVVKLIDDQIIQKA